jgi:hypothetical protein
MRLQFVAGGCDIAEMTKIQEYCSQPFHLIPFSAVLKQSIDDNYNHIRDLLNQSPS